jgi:hypothetical protein
VAKREIAAIMRVTRKLEDAEMFRGCEEIVGRQENTGKYELMPRYLDSRVPTGNRKNTAGSGRDQGRGEWVTES